MQSRKIRIIAGSLRGKKLKSLPGLSVRPLLARVKKSLFDILAQRITGASFLDLYAGTGSVGLEALSRGAKRVIFVEDSADSVKIIRENIHECRMDDHSEVVKNNVIKTAAFFKERFDIIFVGPPYNANLCRNTLEALLTQDILAIDGIIVIQHHCKEDVPVNLGNLTRFRQEKYGDMRLSFMSHK